MPLELSEIQNALVAAAVTALMLWLLQPVACRFNFLDVPKGRKKHARPTPYIGGLAMGLGVLSVGFASSGRANVFLGFALGAALLIVVGLLDDRFDLKWYWRICMQALAALSMIYVSDVRVEQLGPAFGLSETSLGSLSVPFTIFATVGLINAVNMVDGIDGLAGSLVASALLLLLAASVYSGNLEVAGSVLLLAGGVLAFLAYNMRFPWQPKAIVFMGNAGSAFLGYSIAWLTFRLTQNAAHPVSPVLALWFIPFPIMDTLVLMIRRVRTGRSPFEADRNHIHHLLVEAGLNPGRACVILSGLTLLAALGAAVALRMDVSEPILLAAFFLLCLAWYWVTMSRRRAVLLLRRIFASGSRGVGANSGRLSPGSALARVEAARVETTQVADHESLRAPDLTRQRRRTKVPRDPAVYLPPGLQASATQASNFCAGSPAAIARAAPEASEIECE